MTFKTKAFKKWLDHIAGVAVKTRDNFTCQLNMSPDCLGSMQPGDLRCQACHIESRKNNITRWDPLNIITGCANCHGASHSSPLLFALWFAKKYPNRVGHLEQSAKEPLRTWRQSDFEREEKDLFEYCIDMNVDYLSVNTKHRARYKRRIEQILFERKE